MNQLTVLQLLGVLNRHRFKAFIVWFLVMLVFLAAFLVWPRKYSSEGKVYVQLGRIATEISPTTGSQSISVQDTRESEVLSVVEIIRSRGVTEAVVDEVGAKRILASPLDKFCLLYTSPSPRD